MCSSSLWLCLTFSLLYYHQMKWSLYSEWRNPSVMIAWLVVQMENNNFKQISLKRKVIGFNDFKEYWLMTLKSILYLSKCHSYVYLKIESTRQPQRTGIWAEGRHQNGWVPWQLLHGDITYLYIQVDLPWLKESWTSDMDNQESFPLVATSRKL